MTNLEFDDYFRIRENSRGHRYFSHNRYEDSNGKETDILFSSKDKEKLFVLQGYQSYHKDNYLHIQGRISHVPGAKTVAGISKLVDICRVPIIINLPDSLYIVGKGFIAKYSNKNVEILFAACVPIDKIVNNISEVKFYVSRKIYGDQISKRVVKVIEKFIDGHSGDVIITSNIDSYVGHTIQYPVFKYLPDRNKYLDRMMTHCIEKMRKSLE